MVFCSPKRRKAMLLIATCAGAGVIAVGVAQAAALGDETASAQAANAARPVGTIKSISGNNIILTTDAGSEVSIQVQDGARLLRVEPGQKDLKEAVAMQLQELVAGDRILVRGQLAADGKTVLATSVIAMKKADIAEKQAKEREDWQRQGTAGLVSSVDAAANSIAIALPGVGEKKMVTIHLTKDTILRRYSPDSVKFDDAKPAPLDQIKPGDQIRARGTRSPDGSELTAVEVVSGTFRNLSGRISAIDASANSITLQDLATKKNVTVKITADSQVRKLPQPMAQRIAMRLKGGAEAAAAVGASSNAAGGAANPGGNAPQGMRPGGPGAAGGAGRSGGGGGDLQQAINRVPAATLADLQKGDAVMIVATEGGPNSLPSVITLLAGVEPILEASPNSSAASILSPWSLGGEPSGDAGNP
jgi:Domain of unknown function (DUF5666)